MSKLLVRSYDVRDRRIPRVVAMDVIDVHKLNLEHEVMGTNRYKLDHKEAKRDER